MDLKRSHLPDLASLQAFECAARHENFTLAAEELNLTQSTISRQIRAVEEQFGQKLFERIRRNVVLTSAGRTLLAEISELLRASRNIVLRARSIHQQSQQITLATLPTFGSRWLMRHLTAFLERHPDIDVTIISRSVPFDMDLENVDMAIHYGQPTWPRAMCDFLRDEEVAPVSNPRLAGLWRGVQGQVRPAVPLLHLTTRPYLWHDWLAAAHLAEHHNAFKGNRFDDFDMMIQATIAGMGVSLLPLYLIEAELASGALEVVADYKMKTTNSYYIVTPEDRQHNPAVNKLRDWILSA